MHGFNPRNPNSTRCVDYTAYYHNNVGGVKLADGHAEIEKWVDPRTSVPIRKGVSISIVVSSPKNDDILWLQQRSAPPKRRRR